MNMKIYKNYAIRVSSLNQIKLYIDVRFPCIKCWKYSIFAIFIASMQGLLKGNSFHDFKKSRGMNLAFSMVIRQ